MTGFEEDNRYEEALLVFRPCQHHATCQSGGKIMYAWAKDAPPTVLPAGVGFKLDAEQDEYLVLQVHYAHLDAIPYAGDESGVFLEYSPHPEPRVAGVLLLGTGGMTPPHATTYFETACEVEDDRDIHPFAFRTHTHKLGEGTLFLS